MEVSVIVVGQSIAINLLVSMCFIRRSGIFDSVDVIAFYTVGRVPEIL